MDPYFVELFNEFDEGLIKKLKEEINNQRKLNIRKASIILQDINDNKFCYIKRLVFPLKITVEFIKEPVLFWTKNELVFYDQYYELTLRW
jgi:hypothetical protein